jgi:hypothetical protein
MGRALLVFVLFLVGALLIAVALFGMFGTWKNFLFISLEPLQTSPEWVIGLTVGGVLCWVFGGILLRVRT